MVDPVYKRLLLVLSDDKGNGWRLDDETPALGVLAVDRVVTRSVKNTTVCTEFHFIRI
jgi:hypothetical protein